MADGNQVVKSVTERPVWCIPCQAWVYLRPAGTCPTCGGTDLRSKPWPKGVSEPRKVSPISAGDQAALANVIANELRGRYNIIEPGRGEVKTPYRPTEEELTQAVLAGIQRFF